MRRKCCGGRNKNKKVQSGTGLMKRLKNFFRETGSRLSGAISGPRQTRGGPKFRKFLKQYGKSSIVKISICRAPVISFAQKALNITSLGAWERAKTKIDQNDIYHLCMYLTFDNGKTYRIEKNEVITVEKTSKMKGDCIDVSMNGRKIQLNNFIENSRKHDPLTFYLYSSKTNNCQLFVANLMKYNNLLTREIKEFVLQDTVKLFEQLPSFIEKVANVTTNLAARVDILIHGRGTKEKNKVYFRWDV
jgi:hypothetical protein